jgi:hypothetical protein
MPPPSGKPPGNPASEQLDAGDEQSSLGTFYGCFKVLGKPAVAAEPGDGAFDDPSPSQGFEAFGSF